MSAAVLVAEALVFSLIVLLLVLWVILAVLVTGWSMWFQSAIYTEPATGLVWRGPAAASALMVVVLVWVVLAYRSPGEFRPLWETTSTEQQKPYEELRVPVGKGKEEVYKRRPGSRGDYRLNGLPSGKRLGTPPSIIVEENGQKYTFEPERDAQGNFKRSATEPLRYRDERGRVMLEGSLGETESFRAGLFLANVLLNLAFLGGAFLGLWLLAQFQWWHALLQAVVLCLLMLLFVMPPLLKKTEDVAQKGGAAPTASLLDQADQPAGGRPGWSGVRG